MHYSVTGRLSSFWQSCGHVGNLQSFLLTWERSLDIDGPPKPSQIIMMFVCQSFCVSRHCVDPCACLSVLYHLPKTHLYFTVRKIWPGRVSGPWYNWFLVFSADLPVNGRDSCCTSMTLLRCCRSVSTATLNNKMLPRQTSRVITVATSFLVNALQNSGRGAH